MNKMMYQLKERTFVNDARDTVYPEGHEEAAHLLGPAGYLIPRAYAIQLGLLEESNENESREDVSAGTSEGVEQASTGREEETNANVDGGTESESDAGVDDRGQGRKALEPQEDKSLKPQENKAQNPFIYKKELYPEGSQQYNTVMTILQQNNIEQEHLPFMLDADILAIDGISRNRLELIRAHFPAEESNGPADDS